MTEQEFAALAAACDQLLRAPDTSLARLAIARLHLISEHPSCLEPYAELVHSQPRARAFPDLTDPPRAVMRATRALGRSIRDRREHSAAPVPTNHVDVLIVSYLVAPSQLSAPMDFYFGHLQQLLHERGATSRLVLINSLPAAQNRYASGEISCAFPRTVLPLSCPAPAEADIWRQCVVARRTLRASAPRANTRIEGNIAAMAARQAWLAPTVANLRVHWWISQICKRTTPDIVLTTFEGDACERVIWNAARSAKRNTLCVGYQHAAILRRSHSIRRAVGVPALNCDPNVILTLGDVTHEALAASPGLSGIQLIKYGSHRRPAAAAVLPWSERPARCLVIPDADPLECAILFKFALACARQSLLLTFALRPHPMSSLAELRSQLPELRDLPANVTLSVDTPLEVDCSRARYCLYRGSSAVMHAVLAGLKPFYLALPDEMPFDPLFALSAWRETVTSSAEFVARVTTLAATADPEALSKALSFCDQYIRQVRSAAVEELLERARQ